jgi:dienelactone hydrolase
VAERAAFESEMRDGGVSWQMNVYGKTVHSFTNPTAVNAQMPDAVRYNPEADLRSWKAMQDFFAETLA